MFQLPDFSTLLYNLFVKTILLEVLRILSVKFLIFILVIFILSYLRSKDRKSRLCKRNPWENHFYVRYVHIEVPRGKVQEIYTREGVSDESGSCHGTYRVIFYNTCKMSLPVAPNPLNNRVGFSI